MLEPITRAALLAPVPHHHLKSALDTCRCSGKVAFGSNAWQTFRDLDDLREGRPVEVFIYPSHLKDDVHFEVQWRALYVGYVESVNGVHPDGIRYRPQSALTDGVWAGFWEVVQLEELVDKDRVRIAHLQGFGKRARYKRNFAPEGPMLIENPRGERR